MRLTGNWEAWLDFFAEAVIVTATQAVETAQQLVNLANKDRDEISSLGRANYFSFSPLKQIEEYILLVADDGNTVYVISAPN